MTGAQNGGGGGTIPNSHPHGVSTIALHGTSVSLFPFTASHLTADYVGWLNDAHIVRFSEQRHRRHDAASCRAFLNRFDQLTSHFWAICLTDGTHVGTATAYRDVPNETADMGILIGKAEAHGSGAGTAAWVLMRDWLFATGVRKVTAGTMSINAPMLRVFDKAGMVVEGVQRRHFLWNGTEVDLILAAAFNDRKA